LIENVKHIDVSANSESIVIFGKGQLAIDICDYLYSRGCSIIVVPVDPEPEWSPSLSRYCSELNIPIVAWSEFVELKSIFDLGISVYFDRIFKEVHLNRFKLILNIHNSLLPKYRGVRPIDWALANKEKEHGVTIHRVDLGIDTGAIYGQQKFIIKSSDKVEVVYARCLEAAFELFSELFPKLDEIRPIEQMHNLATYYSKEDYYRHLN
jgi:methionyl-tRNA formyltransferase